MPILPQLRIEKQLQKQKEIFFNNNDCMLMVTPVAYLYGSIPVAENAAMAFVIISLTMRCKFLDK